MALTAGTRLGPYEILGLIGAGGMGEVYKAKDTRLDRPVAIKVLPAGISNHPDRRPRFEREAKTIATLSHPHICTLHDVGEHAGSLFLVMELLEGQTLERRVGSRPLPRNEILELGMQVADALDSAHSRGIIHRDIKPSNIFVTDRGQTKILDFGLATTHAARRGKVVAESTLPTQTDQMEHLTSPGTALGTIAYMSPEQARGEVLDPRTDLFSFGAVLYQMATGRRPFTGNTSAVIFNAILNSAPTPAGRLNSELTADLERVIGKCLEKDRELRYQTAAEVRGDLKRIRRDSESAKISAVPAAPGANKPRRRLIVALLAVATAVTLAAALLWPRKPTPVERSEWVQLTDFADSVTSPSFSPDGRMLTFIRGPESFATRGQIYVKLLPKGDPVRLTQDDTEKDTPVFSPDSSRIAYTVPWDTWIVPVLGGTPKLWLPNAASLTWIDGERLMFSELRTGIHMAVATALESRVEQRDVYVPPSTNGMAHRSYLSPDRKWVLVVEMNGWRGFGRCRLVPFDRSSPAREVGPEGACLFAAWSPDGKWMYLNSDGSGAFHIWRQRFPTGTLEQVTFGPAMEEGIAIAPDGRTLVTAVGLSRSTVWMRDDRGDRQVSSEGFGFLGDTDSAFSPDGNRLFYLQRSGSPGTESRPAGELWSFHLETGERERELAGFQVEGFSISRDGKQIVFTGGRERGRAELWLASLERRFAPRQLASGEVQWPSFTPNGDIITYVAEGTEGFVYRFKPDGTREKLLRNAVVWLGGVSPDGRWLPVQSRIEGQEVPVEARPLPVGNQSSPQPIHSSIRWSRDGSTAYLRFHGATYQMPADLAAKVLQHIQDPAQLKALAGVRVIDQAVLGHGPASPDQISPGVRPGVYAYERLTVQRNLYQIPLR